MKLASTLKKQPQCWASITKYSQTELLYDSVLKFHIHEQYLVLVRVTFALRLLEKNLIKNPLFDLAIEKIITVTFSPP